MKSVLVTGATGFVGRRVIDILHGAGHRLTLAVRRPIEVGSPPGARVVVVGPIGPDTSWGEALAGVDTVVHLAAHVHAAPERASAEEQMFDTVNRAGTIRLFEEAVSAGASTFLFMSSITVLGGSSEPGQPFDDATPPRPETPYAASKLAAEDALRDRAEDGPTTLVILRPPLICGPGVKANLSTLARLVASNLPLPLGGIPNRRTLLSLDNLAFAIGAVVARPIAGTFVIGDSEPLSTSAIVRHLREGAGGAGWLLPMPVAFTRRLAALAGRSGHARRLLNDLEVESHGFRTAYGWTDVVGTAATLRATGAAARPRR